MAEAGGDDVVFYAAIFDALNEAKDQIDYAKAAEGMVHLKIRLNMAITALKCACEIYGDRVVEMKKEKANAKV